MLNPCLFLSLLTSVLNDRRLQIAHWTRECLRCSALIGLLIACTPAPPKTINLSFQVEPAPRAGMYVLNGTTNLPDRSRITVAGVRYLHDKSVQAVSATADTDYAILARQTIEVTQGKWQATLNLWEIAADGRYQESWQLNQSRLKPAQPAETVTFLAVFEPENQIPAIQEQVEPKNIAFDSASTRVTADGERYFQFSQMRPVNLPTGRTTPPATTTADRTGGGSDRAIRTLGSTPSAGKQAVPTERQTNAPLTKREFVR